LGESLIVAGGGLASVEIDLNVIAVGALTVATTCALWWSYFGSAKLQLDRALGSVSGADLSSMGRDVYSLLHYPMILGVIGVAVAIEEIVLHPAEPLDLANRLTLALGVVLFTGGMSMSLWRATGSLPAMRLALAGLTAMAVVVAGGVLPVLSLAIAFGGVAILAALEHRAQRL
jgi:low temperature requirement protein LtrA